MLKHLYGSKDGAVKCFKQTFKLCIEYTSETEVDLLLYKVIEVTILHSNSACLQDYSHSNETTGFEPDTPGELPPSHRSSKSML